MLMLAHTDWNRIYISRKGTFCKTSLVTGKAKIARMWNKGNWPNAIKLPYYYTFNTRCFEWRRLKQLLEQ